MKGVLTRMTMNMDGVELNILYINLKCITIKKIKLTSSSSPGDDPPIPPPAERHSPLSLSPLRTSLDVSHHDDCHCRLIASAGCCPAASNSTSPTALPTANVTADSLASVIRTVLRETGEKTLIICMVGCC
jgi:hypothetical protein